MDTPARPLTEEAANNVMQAMPEDGYEWRKYGQKYINTISKNRSYFKCREKSCSVRKKVEWAPADPSNLRIVYGGSHNHRSPASLNQQKSSTSTANQYDLVNQVLRP